MGRAVVHRTPGLIPIEAFTIAGLSAKPNSTNPIGRFGTGLKYAIAVLVRHGIKVTLFIGQHEYVFYKKEGIFREANVTFLRMKRRKGILATWTYHDLPFTTQYGRDWELWQAFRELHANTLDEGGTTYLATSVAPNGIGLEPWDEETLFIIEDSRYVDTFLDMDRIFLPDGARERSGPEGIQVLDRPSKHIYYRGMRVMDLSEKSLYTYNFLEDIDLTEDRTAKYPGLIQARIVGMLQESEDPILLEKTVARPPADSYEGRLGHHIGYSGRSYGYASPGKYYLEAARKSTNPTAKKVWNEKQPTVPAFTTLTIKVPKPELSEYALTLLLEAVELIHPDAKLTNNLGQSVTLDGDGKIAIDADDIAF